MLNGFFILLLLALFVLACLSAYLFGRRFRAAPKGDLRARYVRARGLFLLYMIIFVLEAVIAFQRHDQSLFKKLLVPGCFALCCGLFFFQFIQARRKMREKPGFAEKIPKRPPPVFIWQAVLILLPVAGLVGFGLPLADNRIYRRQIWKLTGLGFEDADLVLERKNDSWVDVIVKPLLACLAWFAVHLTYCRQGIYFPSFRGERRTEKSSCIPVEQEENHEKAQCSSWAKSQM